MLVLTRGPGDTVHIGDNICITVCEIAPGRVRLGIDAPRDVPIYRGELQPAVVGQIEQRAAANSPTGVMGEAE